MANLIKNMMLSTDLDQIYTNKDLIDIFGNENVEMTEAEELVEKKLTNSDENISSSELLVKIFSDILRRIRNIETFWIKTVNGIEAIDGDISLNDDISETMTNYPVFRTGAFGNGVYVAAKKRAGLSWSDDGKTFNACTLNDGSEFNSGDIRVLKFLNGKFFGIDNASYGPNAVKIYVSSDGKTWKITKETPGISGAYFEKHYKIRPYI